MLKTAPVECYFSDTYSKSKCAEIHYHSTNFSILCIFCGFKTDSYNYFCDHFQNHYQDFIKDLPLTEVLSFNEANENLKPIRPDPLKLPATDVKKFPVESLKIMSGQEKEKIKTMECVNQSVLEQQKVRCSDDNSGNVLRCQKIKLEGVSIIMKNKSSPYEELSESDSQELDSISRSDYVVDADVDWADSFNTSQLHANYKRPYKARYTPHACSYCGKTFRRRLQLDTHLNIHTGKKPHQCEICGRQFRAITTLARHRNTHKRDEVFNCKFCVKSFSRRSAMLSHELRHTQERRIPCDECEKQFYTINQMDTHKRKVHNKADDETLAFKCNLCTKRYRSASMLSTHKFKKHYKSAKIFCEKCGKRFIGEQQLEAHKTIHTCSTGSI